MILSLNFINNETPLWMIILLILAGLGLFLFGINLLSTSLKSIAGEKLKLIIEKSTNSPIKGILVGIIITILIQSSSGTTAIIVGLVSAGLMTLPQAICVIMGANIGTTITTVIIGLPISDYFIIFVGIGAILYFFFSKKKIKDIGSALFGFGILFLGLSLMSGALNTIFILYKDETTNLFTKFSNIPILGVLIGAIFTAIIQSSTASIGIIQTLYSQNIIKLNGALAILIGANIGTTITSLISCVGTTIDAKRTSFVHILFNIVGGIIFMILLYPYTLIMSNLENILHLNKELTIALSHIIFNLVSTFILFFFRSYLAKLVTIIIKSNDDNNPIISGLKEYSLCNNSPILALEFAKKSILYMSDVTINYYNLTKDFSFSNTKQTYQASKYEIELDTLDSLIHNYLIKISLSNIDNNSSNILSKYLDTIKDLERIGDHLSNIVEFFDARYNHNIELSTEASKDLNDMYNLIYKMLNSSIISFKDNNKDEALNVINCEEKIDELEIIYRKKHILRLNSSKCSLSNFDFYIDILSNLERIADHTNNIASNIYYDNFEEIENTGLKLNMLN